MTAANRDNVGPSAGQGDGDGESVLDPMGWRVGRQKRERQG